MKPRTVAVIGGGPAGLRAAEVAAERGAEVTVYDAKPSVGRKFLVAGRGGLNLTKAEPTAQFASHYLAPGAPADFWSRLIADFPPAALQEWAAGLGIATFTASTGRIYPREMKAAPLLRRWIERLRISGVRFCLRHRWIGLASRTPLVLQFSTPSGRREIATDAAVLALGGASWPETGSDGQWGADFAALELATAPLVPANCGWEVHWPAALLAVAEGQPLKSIAVRVGTRQVRGELLVTRYGLEGGAIYQLGPALRALTSPALHIDFKPTFSVAELIAKMGPIRRNFVAEARQRLRLPPAAAAILEFGRGPWSSLAEFCAEVKSCPLALAGPRPIAEAISSAGGLLWREIDADLMIRSVPGLFAAGEMLDWEAPTGGYLMQGCFALGGRAGTSAARFAAALPRPEN